MDTVLLFALPLVGGLIFCTRFNFTRWRAAREDGHRLYFRAVFFGALIFASVVALRSFLEPRFPVLVTLEAGVISAIKPMVIPKDGMSVIAAHAIADLAITCFLSMLLAAPFAWLANLFFWKDFWLRRAIKKGTFEAALLEAVDREFKIMVTMDDGKVYVGYVVEGFNPGEDRKFVLMLPLMSGYRADSTHTVNFTTFYVDAYGGDPMEANQEALPGKLKHLRPEDFRVWLPVDKMASCRLFDLVAYKEFQKRGAPAPKPAPPPPDNRDAASSGGG